MSPPPLVAKQTLVFRRTVPLSSKLSGVIGSFTRRPECPDIEDVLGRPLPAAGGTSAAPLEGVLSAFAAPAEMGIALGPSPSRMKSSTEPVKVAILLVGCSLHDVGKWR